jgi:hypothetical protein
MRLDPLFRPESIAVIGASDKPTPGRRIIASLERIGFAGRIFPVNPNYPSVLNRPCYPSPAELPEAPDIAVFCLGHERVFSAFEAAAKRGMVTDGAFELCVPEQELNRPQIAGLLVNLRGLGPPHRVGPVSRTVETGALDPTVNDPSVSSCRDVRLIMKAAREEVLPVPWNAIGDPIAAHRSTLSAGHGF